MALYNRNQLKDLFQTGTLSTEDKFAALIDSDYNRVEDSMLWGPLGYVGTYGLIGPVGGTHRGLYVGYGTTGATGKVLISDEYIKFYNTESGNWVNLLTEFSVAGSITTDIVTLRYGNELGMTASELAGLTIANIDGASATGGIYLDSNGNLLYGFDGNLKSVQAFPTTLDDDVVPFWSSEISNFTDSPIYINVENSFVGIGKTGALYALDVNGDINLDGDLYQNGELFVSSEWTKLEDNTIYYLDNVSIGTTDSSQKLIVQGNILSTGIGYFDSIEVGSTSQVSNLNVSYLEGHDAAYFASSDDLSTKVTSNSDIIAGTGTKITFDSKGLITGATNATYDSSISDTVYSVAVGGAASLSAAEWKNKTIIQVLDSILFPDQLPTYTIATLSLSRNQSGVKEVGTNITQSLTISGVKNDAGAIIYLSLYRGTLLLTNVSNPTGTLTTNIASQYGYTDPNNPNYSYSLTYNDNITVPYGSTSWKGIANFSAGLPKLNNKGVEDTRTPVAFSTSAPQAAASNINTSTYTIEGVYPYFYGKSSSSVTALDVVNIIESGSGFTKVLASGSGTGSLTMNFSASGEWIWFAIYSPIATKTTWYETALNNGSIGGSTDLLSSPSILAIDSPSSYWSNINYKIYVAQKITSIGTTIIS